MCVKSARLTSTVNIVSPVRHTVVGLASSLV